MSRVVVLTGDIELLPKLFERVLVPQVVGDELANAEAPQAVRDWIARAPGWLGVRPAHPGGDDVAVAALDDGERAAIALALAVKAELPDLQPRERTAPRAGLPIPLQFQELEFVK